MKLFLIFFTYMLFAPIRSFSFKWDGTRISFMDSICTLWAFFVAALFYKYNSKILLALGIFIGIYGVSIGADKWREYVAFGELPKS